LRGVSAVDEVDNVTLSDTKSDIGHGESAIAGIEIASNGKGTIQERGVRVGDSDIDRVGVTRAERPVDDIGSCLDPIVIRVWTGDADR